MVCDCAFVRTTEARQGLLGPRIGRVIRRNVADPRVVKYALRNAPETVEPLALVRISGMRWPVALTCAESKEACEHS